MTNKFAWGAFRFILPWVLVVIAGIMYQRDWSLRIAPASDWFEVQSVRVENTEEGKPIILTVTREIKRGFVADWVATVRQLTEDGRSVRVCHANGTNDYTVTSALPVPLTLDWWIYPAECSLKPGRYILETVWTLDLAGDITKEVRRTSPPFVITAAPL